ncbi:MAG: porphobilinogen synthase, partial [Bacteroidota bacterium]
MDAPLLHRPRRLRRSPALRRLVRETRLSVDDLVLPLFVEDGSGRRTPIEAMPGQFRYSVDTLAEEARAVADLGLSAVALFPALD